MIIGIKKKKIDEIINNLPREINFIAWERNGEYILTEWHHRSISIARILKRWWKIKNVKINLYYHPLNSNEKIENIDYINLVDNK